MKQWKCSVCGYIHTGDEPPEKCPVCGADRSKFVELKAEDTAPVEKDSPTETPVQEFPKAASTQSKKTESGLFGWITRNISKHHIHPISVHIPNGVLPAAVIFIFLALLFGSTTMDHAAFYNMIYVVLAMPLVLFSGYTDWKNRYNRQMTSFFAIKIMCGGIVLASSVILVLWRFFNPGILHAGTPGRWAYFGVAVIMLAAAGVAGFIGGKLVFKD